MKKTWDGGTAFEAGGGVARPPREQQLKAMKSRQSSTMSSLSSSSSTFTTGSVITQGSFSPPGGMGSEKRLSEYFLVTKLAKDPIQVGPNVHDGELDPGYVSAVEMEKELMPQTPEQEARKRKVALYAPDLFATPRPIGDDNPIEDICVIFPNQREKIPSGYRCLVRTPFGYRGDCNTGVVGSEGVFICVKHFKTKSRSSGSNIKPGIIIDVKVIFVDKEPVPEGYELIKYSRTGLMPANLNYGYLGQTIHLAVKRLPKTVKMEERYHSHRPVVDVCLINASKQETVPIGYEIIYKSTSDGNWTGNKMYLCIKKAAGAGLLDTPFSASLSERVPRDNHRDLELSDEMALFTAPNGLNLKWRETTNVPLPEFFSFVSTRDDGSQIHGTCFTFYETLDDSSVKFLENSYDLYLQRAGLTGDPMILRQLQASAMCGRCSLEMVAGTNTARVRFKSVDSVDTPVMEGSNTEGDTPRSNQSKHSSFDGRRTFKIYEPVKLTILSRYPFYREFKRFLMLLYQVSISKTVIPIERYIGQLMFELPVPKPGALGFELRFGSGDHGIRFALPSEQGLPMCSVNYETVFRCLGIKEFITLFTLMLLEKKILLHSRYTSVLNQVAQSIISLMFPLTWQNIFIPVCPANLVHVLHAPMPFVVGLHSDAMAQAALPPGIWEVDLDEGKIYYLDHLERVTMTPIASLLQTPPGDRDIDPVQIVRSIHNPPTLPAGILQSLTKRLRTAVFSRAPSLEEEIGKGAANVSGGLQNPDMAYALTPLEASGESALNGLQFAVRDAVINAMIELIGTYRDYLLPPKLAEQGLSRQEVTPTNLPNIFNLNGFLESVQKQSRPFVTELTKTLHFTQFVDERTFSTLLSYKFMFFDALTTEYQNRNSYNEEGSVGNSGSGSSPTPESVQGSGSSLGNVRGSSPMLRPASGMLRKTSTPSLKRPSSFFSMPKMMDSSSRKFSGGASGLFQQKAADKELDSLPLLLERVLSKIEPSRPSPTSADGQGSNNNTNNSGVVSLATTGSSSNGGLMTFEGGGGEECFTKMRDEQMKTFKLLKYRNRTVVSNPWKDIYIYDHFPVFDEVLLMSCLNKGKSTTNGLTMREKPRLSIDVTDDPLPMRTRPRARSSPVQSNLRKFGQSDSVTLLLSPRYHHHMDKNIWGDDDDDDDDDGYDDDDDDVRSSGFRRRRRRRRQHHMQSHGNSDELIFHSRSDEAHGLMRKFNTDPWVGGRSRAMTDGSADDPRSRGYRRGQTPIDESEETEHPRQPIHRVNSANSRYALAGVRLSEELNLTKLELQFAFSELTTGMPRAKACLVEVVGAWASLLPVLLTAGYDRPCLVLVYALASVRHLTRRFGPVLDEAACRSFLAGCTYCGASFAPDANVTFHDLLARGCKPNAVTYGFFTQALAIRNTVFQTDYGGAKSVWKRLRNFLWAYLSFLGVKNKNRKSKKKKKAKTSLLEGVLNDAEGNENDDGFILHSTLSVFPNHSMRFISMWCETTCVNCKGKLLDEHLMLGWEAEEEQLGQNCFFCGFLVVPKLNFVVYDVKKGTRVTKQVDHGQCEYMSPVAVRGASEALLEELGERMHFKLTRDLFKHENKTLYFNILWYGRRLRLPTLFFERIYEKQNTLVHCSWQKLNDIDKFIQKLIERRTEEMAESNNKSEEAGGEDERDNPIPPTSQAPPKGKRMMRKYNVSHHVVEETIDPSVYFIKDLDTFPQLDNNTLWGNEKVKKILNDPDIANSPIPETFHVTQHSTPLNVIRKLLYYLEETMLVHAIRLFLSARMVSRGDVETEEYPEYGGHFVCLGWEIFSNSIYIELNALSRMSPKISRDIQELELERALEKALRNVEHVDPTLASFVVPQDFPPPMRALAFRHFFSTLYP